MDNKRPVSLELLAPARDLPTGLAAISHGADAVYIGSPAFGARAAAANSVDDIAELVKAAHPFGVRVYVTFNTIIFENEIREAEQLVWKLWRVGVDALIVQDMALLRMNLPPIELHASTQADCRSPQKARWLSQAGFSQIVVPREFTVDEIRQTALAVAPTSIEAFVHGALCVSYSGDCQAGQALSGRSANRGECPQICRLEFTLTDKNGRSVDVPDGGSARRHWLSLADMCRIENLAEMADAGVRSFKIEGRLKNVSYVKNVTAAYSEALDRVVESSGGKYVRASYGRVDRQFSPDVNRSFNRGFTPFFLDRNSRKITSFATPKWIGRPVAAVVKIERNFLKVESTEPINNGDGLGFFDSDGAYHGFRVNRAEGVRVFPAPGSDLPRKTGTELYRNLDVAFENKLMRADSAVRTIGLKMTLRRLPNRSVALDISDERGASATVVSDSAFESVARTPQAVQRRTILSRLGDTIYVLKELVDDCGDMFIPSKDLTSLRRQGLKALETCWNVRYSRGLRAQSNLPPEVFKDVKLTYHDNLANSLAKEFYLSHGAQIESLAAEVAPLPPHSRVMTTRYCLRRELDCCLKGPNARRLPSELFLNAPIGRLQLKFDCKNCRMEVFK